MRETECDACGLKGYHTVSFSTVRGPERPLCQDCFIWGRSASEAAFHLACESEQMQRRANHVLRLARAEKPGPAPIRGFEVTR